MNKVSVEISANVNGYVQGMNQASESTQKYESDMRKVSDYTVSFNKKLRDSKKEVKDLAISYAMLDKETKNSDFGKRMKQQLEAAKKEAAELIDMQGDIQRELKNMSSDTKMLDMAADSFGLIANMASGAAGAIALVTGNEKDAQRAVVAFTTAQSAMNSVIGIGNALQKESNVMLAVSAIQKKAEAAATQLQASSTVGATIAQKAFNAVANANPYVLLATAIIAVVGAVTAFIAITNQAESAEQKIAKTLHEASLQGQSDAQAEITKLNILYKTATDENQTRETRLKAVKKLQQEYPSYLGNLSQEAIMAGQAAGQYQKLATAIINAAKARAYENQITKNQEEIIRRQQKEQEYANRRATEDQRKQAVNNLAKKVSFVAPGAGLAIQAGAEIAGLKEDKERRDNLAEINRLNAENNKLGEEAVKYKKDELDLDKQINKEVSKRGGGGGGKNTPKDVKPEAMEGSITQMQQRVNEIKKQLEDGFISGYFDTQEALQEIDNLETKIKNRKIQLGWEVDPKEEEAKKAQEEIQKALKKANADYATIKFKPDQSSFEKAMGKELFSKGLEGIEQQMNFNDKLIEQLRSIRDEYIALGTAGATAAAAITSKMEDLIDKNEELANQGREQSKKDKEDKEKEEKMKELIDTTNEVSASFAALGSIFKQTGEEGLAAMLQITSSVGQAVAQIIPEILKLIAAKEGETMASGMASAAELPYPANLGAIASIVATVLAMIAQIASVVGSYAEGGKIPGNSYSGDKLLARVNSGEVILNERQQNRALELMDNATTPSNIGAIHVEGKIRGTDILLVGKNTNKMLAKSGNIINIQ